MERIRRIYVFVLAGAGLAALASGVADVLRVLLEVAVRTPAASANTERFLREGISVWGAAALVGLPIWALHWAWAQRSTRSGAWEPGLALRRLYLYLVLAFALIALTFNAVDLLDTLVAPLDVGRRAADLLGSAARTLPTLLVASAVWAYHLRVTRADWAAVGEAGASATLRRWYVYGAALLGWWSLLDAGAQVLGAVWTSLADTSGPGQGGVLLSAVPGLLVSLAVWLTHWAWLPRGPIAEDDHRSTLRVVYLFLGLLIAVVGTLSGASQLLYYALARLLGVERPGGVGGSLLVAAATPGSAALVFGLGWWYQGAALRVQAARSVEQPRQAGIRRFATYLVALAGLAALGVGVGGVLWTLLDLALAGTSGEAWRSDVARFITITVVGLAAWLASWRPSTRVSASEARALSRRLYLYLGLIGAMLAVLGGGGTLLYRLLTLLLGEAASRSLLGDLAHAVAVLLVGGVVAVYQARAIRRDGRAAASASGPTAERPAPPAPVRATVQLEADDAASFAAALDALRVRGVRVASVNPAETTPPSAAPDRPLR